MSRRAKTPLGPLGLPETVADHESRITTQHEDVGRLYDAVGGLGGQITKIADWLEARPGGPWSWRTLDQETAKELWMELYDWVNWLRDRYLVNLAGETYRLINDWYKHPVAVELLTALMVSHQSVYRRTRAAPSFDLVEWHERCLWPTFARMKDLALFPPHARTEDSWELPESIQRTDDSLNFARFLVEDLTTRPEKDSPAEPVNEPPVLTDADAPPVDEAEE